MLPFLTVFFSDINFGVCTIKKRQNLCLKKNAALKTSKFKSEKNASVRSVKNNLTQASEASKKIVLVLKTSKFKSEKNASVQKRQKRQNLRLKKTLALRASTILPKKRSKRFLSVTKRQNFH